MSHSRRIRVDFHIFSSCPDQGIGEDRRIVLVCFQNFCPGFQGPSETERQPNCWSGDDFYSTFGTPVSRGKYGGWWWLVVVGRFPMNFG